MKKIINQLTQINYNKLTIISSIVFGFAFALLSILRFNHFMMGSFDLAIFDQAIWHYGRLEAPVSTVREMNILGDHFSPLLMLLGPLRFLWGDAQILLIVQALVASFSQYFIFLTLQRKLNNSFAAFLLSLTTFFFLGFQYALDYDFHLISLSVLPISMMIYGLFSNRIKTYWLGIILMFLLKEDMAILVFFVGLYQVPQQKSRSLGIRTALAALSFFLIESVYLMPIFQDNPAVVKNYVDFYALGDTRNEMVINGLSKPWLIFQSMFDSPKKIHTIIQTHLNFGFLPLFSPFYVVAAFPIWLERMLSFTQTRWLFDQYYGISLTPFLVVGTGQTIRAISNTMTVRILRMPTELWMTIVVFLYSFGFVLINHAPITRLVHPQYHVLSPEEQSMHRAVSLIDETASVSAQQPFVSHLSGRSEIYWFPKQIDNADFVITTKTRPATPLENEERDAQIDQLLKTASKQLIFAENGVYLFKNY